MKVFDCFTFFNELDLLEFRLKLLNDRVDHFIIAESNITHSGKPKPFYFEENRQRFESWKDKIIYIKLNQNTAGLEFKKETTYNPLGAAWKLENEQRNALIGANQLIADDDLVLLSDLDEIPDPEMFKDIDTSKGPVVLSELFHYYFLNCQNIGNERWWNGTIAASGKQFKETTPQLLRDKRNEWPVMKRAGWHFSYLGGIEKIKEKIRSFAHTEFNKAEFTNDENIMQAMEKGEDIFKRPNVHYQFVTLYYYPPHIRAIMREYPQLLHLKQKPTLWDRIYFEVKHKLK